MQRELPWEKVEEPYYHYLDIVPKGRDEGDRPQYWVKRHDEYGRAK